MQVQRGAAGCNRASGAGRAGGQVNSPHSSSRDSRSHPNALTARAFASARARETSSPGSQRVNVPSCTRSSPSTMAVRTSVGLRRIDERGIGIRRRRLMRSVAPDKDEVGAEARGRPARSPCASPNARAPPRVAMASTSRAGSVPGPLRTACKVAASRISWNMSRWLLHAAPSAPNDSGHPELAQLDHRRDARTKLEVGSRAVQDVRPPLGQ